MGMQTEGATSDPLEHRKVFPPSSVASWACRLKALPATPWNTARCSS